MGSVTFSIDRTLVEFLVRELQLEVLVETGTFQGGTIRATVDLFQEIHSVELSPELFGSAEDAFSGAANVSLAQGRSAPFLEHLRPSIADRPTLFFLDAHWSAGDSETPPATQCPLMDELSAVGSLNERSAIIIDDARLFLRPVPVPLDPDSWPAFDEVVDGLRKLSGDHRIMVLNDTILFFPAAIKSKVTRFAQQSNLDLPAFVQDSSMLMPLEEDRRAKEEVIAGLVTELEVVRKDHAARGELIEELDSITGPLVEDRQAKEEVIEGLATELDVVRKDHAARGELIEELDSKVKTDELLKSNKNDPIDQMLEKLESIDRRLGMIEVQKSSRLRSLLGRFGPQQLFLRIRRPPVLRFQQHQPRALHVPTRYGRQSAPKLWPRIGMVTPSYNHAQFLKATIDSVLGQNCPTLHYLVQDGASTDGTPELLESFGNKLNWRSEPDTGQSQAINRGFDGVECDVMAYLNSDDVLLPGALAYVARYFAEHPDIDLIYGHRISIDRDGFEIGRAILPPHDDEVLKWADFVPQETLFWRRRVWDALNGIDESFRFAMDWDFLLRAQKEGFKLARVPRFLGCFRVHDEQKTSAISDVGAKEMDRLKRTHLGYVPAWAQTKQAIKPYLMRHLIHQWLYLLKVLRY